MAQLAALPMHACRKQSNYSLCDGISTRGSTKAPRKYGQTMYGAHICRKVQNMMRRECWAKSTVIILRSKLQDLTGASQIECRTLQAKLDYAYGNLDITRAALSKSERSNKLLTEELVTCNSRIHALESSILSLKKQNLEHTQMSIEVSSDTKRQQAITQQLQARNHTLKHSHDALRKRIARSPIQKARAATKLAESKSTAAENRALKDTHGVRPEIRDLLRELASLQISTKMTRLEQNKAWELRAENNRVKQSKTGERKAATKRRLLASRFSMVLPSRS